MDKIHHKEIVERHQWSGTLKKFLSFDARRAEFALRLDRKDLRLLAGTLTGHYTCNAHLYRMGSSNTESCRFCGLEKESTEHLITNCVALGHRRYRLLNAFTLDEQDMLTLPLMELLLFISVINLFEISTVDQQMVSVQRANLAVPQ